VIFGASVRNRHIVARLDQGEDFIETLKKFFQRERAKSCVFSGFGYFSKCSLQQLNVEKHVLETIFSTDSPLTVSALSGNISAMGSEIVVNCACTASYRMFGQNHVIAGIIQDARVYSLELHLIIFDDLIVVRSFDPITGLVPIHKIRSSFEENTSMTDVAFISNNPKLDSYLDMSNDSSLRGISIAPELMDSSLPPPPKEIIRKRTRTSQNIQNFPPPPAQPPNAAPSPSTAHQPSPQNQDPPAQEKRRVRTKSITRQAFAAIDELAIGDWLEHPTIGLCRVESLPHDDTITIKTQKGSQNTIALKYFVLIRLNDIEGIKRFRLTPK